MPELPEVETIKNQLKKVLIGNIIEKADVNYDNIIENISVLEFRRKIKNQKIIDINRRGKWLIFELNNYYLLSHLRMEGKYFIRNSNYINNIHDHVIFYLNNKNKLVYQDTRKFGKMHLINKNEEGPLEKLGLEPWDNKLDIFYLKEKFKNKNIPIKSSLLDQSIIAGIGNIYADEILFLSKINPLKNSSILNDIELKNIICNTRIILNRAIELGGSTIHTYSSLNGVVGSYQNELLVHSKKVCSVCNNKLEKIYVNQRGTYYCPTCQK